MLALVLSVTHVNLLLSLLFIALLASNIHFALQASTFRRLKSSFRITSITAKPKTLTAELRPIDSGSNVDVQMTSCRVISSLWLASYFGIVLLEVNARSKQLLVLSSLTVKNPVELRRFKVHTRHNSKIQKDYNSISTL